jgi:ABC-2 type transport system ATP-binding protein
MNNTNKEPKASNKVLEIHDLCLSFGKKKVLDQLNVEFVQGEAVLIAGSNGVGKTSLLRCITGVYLPGSGQVRFGESVTKKKIGLISDKMSLFESFTLQEGIDFHCRVFNLKHFNDSLIKPLNIDKNQKIKDLSAGERALYHLSLLLSQKPAILLVDEIIHAVDPYLRELFLEALIEMIAEFNTTLIMVNQTFTEMGRIPERVLIMQDGGFVLDEKRDDLHQKMKKILSDKEISGDIPVVFKKESPVINEYYVYPFTAEIESKYGYDFREVDLTEIIKSFIGGYYAKKRS